MEQGAADFLANVTTAFLALVLLASAAHKLIEARRLMDVLRALAGVSLRFAPYALATVVAIEAACGLALCIDRARPTGAAAAMLIWICYAALLGKAIVDGRRDTDCGCTLAARHASRRANPLRPLLLAAMAAIVAQRSFQGATAPFDLTTTLLPAFAFFALYAAWDHLPTLDLGRTPR